MNWADDGLPDEAWALLQDAFNAGYQFGYHNGWHDHQHNESNDSPAGAFEVVRDEAGPRWADRLHALMGSIRSRK